MPVIPSWLLEPLWDQFTGLLPERSVYHPARPLGCHRRRMPDRIVFDKLLHVPGPDPGRWRTYWLARLLTVRDGKPFGMHS